MRGVDRRDRVTSRTLVPHGTEDVVAILVNWNSSKDALEAVDTIRRLHPGLGVTVIDNGSSASDMEQLEHSLPADVQLLVHRANLGYAAGVNTGLTWAENRGFSWAWLINPDSRPDPDSLNQLLLASGGAMAVSPRQVTGSTADRASTYVSAALIVGDNVSPLLCNGCAAGSHDVSVITGTGLLIRVATANTIGGMCEEFFSLPSRGLASTRRVACYLVCSCKVLRGQK
jgi:GT2 family glycosyltransferase